MDPNHSHLVGLDIQKESELLAEKVIEKDLLVDLMNGIDPESANDTKHLINKFNEDNILTQSNLSILKTTSQY